MSSKPSSSPSSSPPTSPHPHPHHSPYHESPVRQWLSLPPGWHHWLGSCVPDANTTAHHSSAISIPSSSINKDNSASSTHLSFYTYLTSNAQLPAVVSSTTSTIHGKYNHQKNTMFLSIEFAGQKHAVEFTGKVTRDEANQHWKLDGTYMRHGGKKETGKFSVSTPFIQPYLMTHALPFLNAHPHTPCLWSIYSTPISTTDTHISTHTFTMENGHIKGIYRGDNAYTIKGTYSADHNTFHYVLNYLEHEDTEFHYAGVMRSAHDIDDDDDILFWEHVEFDGIQWSRKDNEVCIREHVKWQVDAQSIQTMREERDKLIAKMKEQEERKAKLKADEEERKRQMELAQQEAKRLEAIRLAEERAEQLRQIELKRQEDERKAAEALRLEQELIAQRHREYEAAMEALRIADEKKRKEQADREAAAREAAIRRRQEEAQLRAIAEEEERKKKAEEEERRRIKEENDRIEEAKRLAAEKIAREKRAAFARRQLEQEKAKGMRKKAEEAARIQKLEEESERIRLENRSKRIADIEKEKEDRLKMQYEYENYRKIRQRRRILERFVDIVHEFIRKQRKLKYQMEQMQKQNENDLMIQNKLNEMRKEKELKREEAVKRGAHARTVSETRIVCDDEEKEVSDPPDDATPVVENPYAAIKYQSAGILPQFYDLLIPDAAHMPASSFLPCVMPDTIIYHDGLPTKLFYSTATKHVSTKIIGSEQGQITYKQLFVHFENIVMNENSLLNSGSSAPTSEKLQNCPAVQMVSIPGTLPTHTLTLYELGILLKNGISSLIQSKRVEAGYATTDFILHQFFPPLSTQTSSSASKLSSAPNLLSRYYSIYHVVLSSPMHVEIFHRLNQHVFKDKAVPLDLRTITSQTQPHLSDSYSQCYQLKHGNLTYMKLYKMSCQVLKNLNTYYKKNHVEVQRLSLYFQYSSPETLSFLYADRMDIRKLHA